MSNRYNLAIQQGATLSVALTWKDSNDAPVNLTGYTARLQVRETYDSGNAVLSLNTSNGGIALGGTAGTINLSAAATATAALSAPFTGVYDLELVSASGDVTRLLEGLATVSPEVTK